MSWFAVKDVNLSSSPIKFWDPSLQEDYDKENELYLWSILTQTVIEGSKGKVTSMMLLGKHMEVLSHAQNTLLVLQGGKRK